MSIANNIASVEQRIQQACDWSRRPRSDIQLIAVTKYATIDQIWEARRNGISVIGENRVQEAEQKQSYLQGLSWHMIGHLQTNKAKKAVALFDMIHSVDSQRLSQSLDKFAAKQNKITDILLQVNIGNDPDKHGVLKSECQPMVKQIAKLKNTRLRGLMCMIPFDPDPEQSRIHYRALRQLRDILQSNLELNLPHLSMGMSHDLEAAIEEGSTMIRIGQAIFKGD